MALEATQNYHSFCDILFKHKVNVNRTGILKKVVQKRDFKLLNKFICAGVSIEEQGMEALVEAAGLGEIPLAALLIHHGVNIDTPGLEINPLQLAASHGHLEMIDFLLDKGADVNAPASLNSGYTALQNSLASGHAYIALHLLDQGADIKAPPAFVGGLTALEAICHNSLDDPTKLQSICNKLLDAEAPVNRPGGKPSSAIHGAIAKGWAEILSRMLEPHRDAITDFAWHDQSNNMHKGPKTPTQLAAAIGDITCLELLLGADTGINEAPSFRCGRTALQAAVSSDEPDMELVRFLLERGANINAAPATVRGITALQGAAIAGDLVLASMLIEKGANVNASPSHSEGRYAIEGAAENGRLDMVQLLLNAGAAVTGTGLDEALRMAEERGHVAIANLLRKAKI